MPPIIAFKHGELFHLIDAHSDQMQGTLNFLLRLAAESEEREKFGTTSFPPRTFLLLSKAQAKLKSPSQCHSGGIVIVGEMSFAYGMGEKSVGEMSLWELSVGEMT